MEAVEDDDVGLEEVFDSLVALVRLPFEFALNLTETTPFLEPE